MAELNEYGEIVNDEGHGVPEHVELKREPIVDERLGDQLDIVCQSFNLEPHTVYFPASGSDVLPRKGALTNSNVVYADIDASAMQALGEAGYDARVADVEDFSPAKPVDLLVLKSFRAEKPLEAVKPGGFVFANGLMGSVDDVGRKPNEFALVGVLESRREQIADGTTHESYIVNKDEGELARHREQLQMTDEQREEQSLAKRRAVTQALLALREGNISALPETPKQNDVSGYVFQRVASVEVTVNNQM